MRHLTCLAAALVVSGLMACSKSPEPPPAAPDTASTEAPVPEPAPAADTGAIEAALASPERLAGDKDEDSWRKPAEVLAFLEVRPGMRVVDYFSAGGYFTELLSRAVGPEGQVIAYNNTPYLNFSAKKVKERYENNRLTNVTQVTTPPEEAPFEPNSLDGALFFMSYHDLYWRPKDGSWPNTDPARSLAKLVPALKPGAAVVVVDHVAVAGSDPLVTADATHRIDPEVIKRDFTAAGLTFEQDSATFANPQDDHTKPVFDESIRHKTDQVMYRFRKK